MCRIDLAAYVAARSRCWNQKRLSRHRTSPKKLDTAAEAGHALGPGHSAGSCFVAMARLMFHAMSAPQMAAPAASPAEEVSSAGISCVIASSPAMPAPATGSAGRPSAPGLSVANDTPVSIPIYTPRAVSCWVTAREVLLSSAARQTRAPRLAGRVAARFTATWRASGCCWRRKQRAGWTAADAAGDAQRDIVYRLMKNCACG
mmetsp:Transcript_24019/g.61608  ORF Transcript_24019/g.61608 Transcript_24019/m.61608 type:complete len:203 (+) Transcript_24019:55-663(+)